MCIVWIEIQFMVQLQNCSLYGYFNGCETGVPFRRRCDLVGNNERTTNKAQPTKKPSFYLGWRIANGALQRGFSKMFIGLAHNVHSVRWPPPPLPLKSLNHTNGTITATDNARQKKISASLSEYDCELFPIRIRLPRNGWPNGYLISS